MGGIQKTTMKSLFFCPLLSVIRMLGISALIAVCLAPGLANAQSEMDSLPSWQAQNQFEKICSKADEIINGKIKGLQPCEKTTFLIAASNAAFSLFQPTRSLQYSRGAIVFNCKDSLVVMQAKMESAAAYNMLMNLDSAIFLTKEVIEFADRKQNANLIIKANTNLGMMLNKRGQYREALSSFRRGYRFVDQKDMRRMATVLANISLCYLNLQELDQALTMVDSALTFAKNTDILYVLAHIMGLKSDIQFAKKDFVAWAPTLDSAIAFSMKAGNSMQAAYGLSSKLDYYLSVKNYPLALRYGQEALSILENSDQYPLLQKNFKAMYTLYKATGDNTNALFFLEKYSVLKDSMEIAQYDEKIHELNLKYEVADKERKIFQQEALLKSNKIWNLTLFSSFMFLALIAFFVAWRNVQYKKRIQELFVKERELEKEIESLYKISTLSEEVSKEDSGPDTESPNSLVKNALILMERDKLYLDPEFSREEFARRLNTNRSYLSQAINSIEEGGFRSFLNKYRVKEAKSLIWNIAAQESESFSSKIWELAGFNSNQTFFRTFKQFTKLTPKEYFEQAKLELKRSKDKMDPDTND